MKRFTVLFLLLMIPTISALEVSVSTDEELMGAIKNAQPGDRISLTPKHYEVNLQLENPGTKDKPIYIQGNGATLIPDGILITAPYWVIEDLQIDGRNTDSSVIYIKTDNVHLNKTQIYNSLHTAIEIQGKEVVIENNTIHNIDALNAWFYRPLIFIGLMGSLVLAVFINKKWFRVVVILNIVVLGVVVLNSGFYTQNKDAHGVLIWPGSENILVKGNTISQVSGDGIQVINEFQNKGRSPAKKITLVNNKIYAAREDCIDIKTSQDTLIENNECSNILLSQTSHGIGITIHAGAKDVEVKNNTIFNTRTGLSVTKGEVTTDPEEVPEGIQILNNTMLSLISTDKEWASASGIIIGEAKSVLVKGNHVQDAESFALGLTKEAKPEEITVVDNTLQGEIALHLNQEYLTLKAEGNAIEGRIEIQDRIQDIEVKGFEKFVVTKKPETNSIEFYQNKNKELQLKWLQVVWIPLLVLSILLLLKRKSINREKIKKVNAKASRPKG